MRILAFTGEVWRAAAVYAFGDLGSACPRRFEAASAVSSEADLARASLADFRAHATRVQEPGAAKGEAIHTLGTYLRDVMCASMPAVNFRAFGPDETSSNRLDALYEVTDKRFMRPLIADEHLGADGRVRPILDRADAGRWHADRK
jgi:xylulose-5-phosphate/fructose-6-phosphate phosphoketolase